MKKEVSLHNLWGSILILLAGIVFLLFPIFKITDVLLVYRLYLGIFVVVSLFQFITTLKTKEYSSFFSFAISIVLLSVSFFVKEMTPKIYALNLLTWLLFVTLGKVKKADFYHDRKSKIWCILSLLWFMFFICGVLTSLNFGFHNTVSILSFGYLTFFYGALEIQEYMITYLTKGKLK